MAMQSKGAIPVYWGSGSQAAALDSRYSEEIGAQFMTFREDINSQGDLVARPLETTRLTRRAVSAGVAAAAGGAAVLALGRFFGGAAAAPTTSGASQPCAAQAAQAAASPIAGKTQVVVIENFTFNPDALTVPAGTEVTWENKDDIPHTVTSDDKKTFASSLLDTGDRFTYTFTKPGTFSYFCSVHPMMTAKVVVQS
jgi:plastocyanin